MAMDEDWAFKDEDCTNEHSASDLTSEDGSIDLSQGEHVWGCVLSGV